MKKFGVLSLICLILAVAAMTMSAAVSYGHPKAGGPLNGKKLVLITYWLDNYGQAYAGWTKQYVESQGGSLQIEDGKADATYQLGLVDNAIAQRVDGIIWQPVAINSAGPEIRKVQNAHIPLVLYGWRPDPKLAGGVTEPSVIINDFAAGFKMGQKAARFVKSHWHQQVRLALFGDITLAGGSIGQSRGLGVMAGVRSIDPHYQLVYGRAGQVGGVDRATARKNMDDLIVRNPHFNVFIGSNADDALGAISALQSAGRAKAVNKVPQTEWIGTFDGTPPELNLLFDKKSSVMGTVTITPRENAKQGLDVLMQVMTGKLAPTSNRVWHVAGALLPANCAQASAIFRREYSVVKAYKPISCPT